MHDPTNGHGLPFVATVSGFVALIADDAGRIVALAVGCGGLAVSLVRLAWDWEDRRERRAARHARPRTDRPSA